MTHNHRYEARYDKSEDARRAAADGQRKPVEVPLQAYGPQELTWAERSDKPPVWAWVLWDRGPATREKGYAAGWNDRVVLFEPFNSWGQLITVWRQAVSVRNDESAPRPPSEG